MAFISETQVQCPVCRQPFVAQLEQIIDVGLEPMAKGRFLSGQVNIARCPKCGNGGMMSAPLLYHDPAHELLLVYVPMELNLPENQREQLIGSLTRTLMSNIPAEARKGYLFNPQTMITFEGLVEKVLEADGISPEVLTAQRERSDLLNRLLSASEVEFEPLAKAHDAQLDDLFFQMLASFVDSARQANRQDEASRLIQLRNRLLLIASWSKERGITAQDLDAQQARIDLIGTLLTSDESSWPELIKQHDKELDYLFFQLLTAVAENGEGEQQAKLRRMRDRLLELSSVGQQVQAGEQAMDGLKEAAQKAGGLTREVLLEQIIQAESDMVVETLAMAASPLIDYSFFILMADKIDAAEKQGDKQEVQRLHALREKLVSTTEKWEKARVAQTEMVNQQIDELLAADNRTEAIEAALPMIDQAFLSILATRAEAARRADQQATAEELGALLEQIMTLIKASAPPEIQFIESLLELEGADAIRAALEARREELTPAVLAVMEQMLAEVRSTGQQELAGKLSTVFELAQQAAG